MNSLKVISFKPTKNFFRCNPEYFLNELSERFSNFKNWTSWKLRKLYRNVRHNKRTMIFEEIKIHFKYQHVSKWKYMFLLSAQFFYPQPYLSSVISYCWSFFSFWHFTWTYFGQTTKLFPTNFFILSCLWNLMSVKNTHISLWCPKMQWP